MPLKSLSRLFGKKVMLLTHSGADVDSFGSASAILFALKGKATVSIGVPDHLNLNAKAFAKKLGIPYMVNPVLSAFEAVVCLDLNKSNMLGSMRESFLSFKGEKFLVDHHSKEREVMAPQNNSLSDPDAVSTTELVYSLVKNTTGLRPGPKVYTSIAAGIITDSASFLIADHRTFIVMGEVMEKSRLNYSGIVSLFSFEKDPSEKIASLKAARRARIFKSGDAIIAVADVGAFEGDSAMALVRTGADVAFCGYSEEGEIRLSGRAKNSWMEANKFNLAKHVFNRLESFFDGEGGGHAGAAGFNGKGKSIKPVLEKCVELVHEFNSGKKKVLLKEYT